MLKPGPYRPRNVPVESAIETPLSSHGFDSRTISATVTDDLLRVFSAASTAVYAFPQRR